MTALVLTVGIIAISFAAIFIKLIGDVHPVIITVWRLLIASALVLPLGAVLLRRRLVEVMVIHSGKLLMASLFLSLHFIVWIASLFYTSVASSVVIVCTNPVWVGLFSFFLGERPGKNAVIGIILTVAGGIIIGWGDFTISPRALFGDLLALLGAFMATGYLLAGRRIRSQLTILEYIVPVYSMAAVIALLIGVLLGLPLSGYSGEQYLLFAALAVVPQLIGHTAFNWALGFLSATVVAVVILGEPVGSTLLASVILGERLTVAKVLGALIIMAGITIALWPARKVEEAGDSLSAW
jgi:drug/metabolite transporter (DMT)-like permease